MNGIDKESLKNMSLNDMVRGLIDMVYNMHESNEKFFKEQPPVCAKKFVKVKHVKIAGVIIIFSLLFGGAIKLASAFRLLPFL